MLIDHVDDYRGMGKFPGFHWWGGFVEDGVISRDGALNGYITPMTDKAEELGVEIVLGARGKKLIMDDGAVADDAAQAWTADSLDELAEAMGIDAATFAETVDVYNSYCANGKDDDFAKEAEMLVAIEEGPFWGFQMDDNYFATLGGIANNRRFEVVDANNDPIPRLYVCGADGCELYRETCTVLLPASCMGNNINSGRNAGLNAAEYVGA